MALLDKVKVVTANITTGKVSVDDICFYDTDKDNSYIHLYFSVGTGKYKVLLSDRQLKSLRASLTIRKKSNALITLNGKIDGDKIIFKIPKSYIQFSGKYECEINAFYKEDESTFDTFIYEVKRSLINKVGDIVEEDKDLPILKNLIEIVKRLQEGGYINFPIDNHLTSYATDRALSANQGRILKDLIDKKSNLNHTHSEYQTIIDGSLTTSEKRVIGAINEVHRLVKNVMETPRINIVDNLLSTSTSNALSANQGKVLKGMITDVNDAINNIRVNEEYYNDNYPEISTVRQALDRLLYVNINITSFTSNPKAGVYEIGTKIPSITFFWDYNKKTSDITSLSLTNCTPTKTTKTYIYPTDISTDKTFTLTIGDGISSTNKALSFKFQNKIYWGSANETTEYNSSFILGLKNSELATTYKKSEFSQVVSDGQYFYYCYPTAWGDAIFSIGGFEGGIDKVGTVNFTNSCNYVSQYNVYRSQNKNLGDIKIIVK